MTKETLKIRGGNILARAFKEKGVETRVHPSWWVLQPRFGRVYGMSDGCDKHPT